jgi:hypothetical protein
MSKAMLKFLLFTGVAFSQPVSSDAIAGVPLRDALESLKAIPSSQTKSDKPFVVAPIAQVKTPAGGIRSADRLAAEGPMRAKPMQVEWTIRATPSIKAAGKTAYVRWGAENFRDPLKPNPAQGDLIVGVRF